MSVFKISDKKTVRLKPEITRNGKKILEKDIQKIFEANLYEILGVNFLASEYSTSFGGRMDSLGIDDDGNPCIIEYKKGSNENVINQGLSYLRWLLDHKENFVLLCHENKVAIQIQWNTPRVICVAESYNKFDADTADLLPINIELYRYKLYEGNILTLDSENYQKVKIQNVPRLKTMDVNEPEKLQEIYTVDDHLAVATEAVQDVFKELRERILALDKEILEEPKKLYIAYKTTRNFVDIVIIKSKLVVYVNMKSGTLDDPRGLARDLTSPKPIGHWGNGDYDMYISGNTDLDYVMGLIQQSYDINQ